MPILTIDKFVGLRDENVASKLSFEQNSTFDLKNVDFRPMNTLTKRGGYWKLHNTPRSSAITKIDTFVNTEGVEHAMLFTCASGAALCAEVAQFEVSGGTVSFTTLLCANTQWIPTFDTIIDMDAYAGSAVWADGGDHGLWAWNGSIATTAVHVTGGSTLSGAKYVCAFGSYLFVGNVLEGATRKGSRLQWNSAGDISNWPATYYFDLDADDGDEITGLYLLEEGVIAFKGAKIFRITWVGEPDLFSWERVETGVGCIAAKTIIEMSAKAGGGLAYLSDTGIMIFNGKSSDEASKAINRKVGQMNFDKAHLAFSGEYSPNDEAMFALPMRNDTRPTTWFVHDEETSEWTKYAVTNITAMSEIIRKDYLTYGALARPYADYDFTIDSCGSIGSLFCVLGTYDGYLMEYGTNMSDDGTDIDAYWCTTWLEFEDPITNKRIRRITIQADTEGATYPLNWWLYRDWEESAAIQSGTVYLDATGQMAEIRIDTSLSGRAFMLKLGTSLKSQPFTLHRVHIDWLPKGRTKINV